MNAPLQRPGWVYVLTNPTLPDTVKIGRTTHTATRRAVQLEQEYGVAAPFEVASKHATPNPAAIEQAAHRMLDDCRLPRSELFRCTPAKAARVIKAAVRAYEKPWAVTVWLRRLLHPPRPQRLSNGWRRSRRRGSADGLIVLAVLVVIAAPVVIFRPEMPPWLPASVIHSIVLLEHLHR